MVTSHVEVWIETLCAWGRTRTPIVTSHVEVWIETSADCKHTTPNPVTSHVEVWIETDWIAKVILLFSHLPRGGVD